MIDRNSPIPLYYQLKVHLKQRMELGDLAPGDRLPTEVELCELFSISRAPVRQALSELVREGLIYRRAGQGSFVSRSAAKGLAEKTKLQVLIHYDVRWMTSLEQAALKWNELWPAQQVELVLRMCGRDEYHQVMRRLAIQGEAPDMAPLDYVWIAHYASEGYIAPLASCDAAWAEELRRELEPTVFANNSFEDRLYGVPVQADITGLWYRRDWLEAEGLAPPETWQEWLDGVDHFAQPAVKERWGHRYPLVLPVTSMTGEATVNLLIPFLWMCGADVVDAGGALVLQSYMPQVAEALRFLQQITVQRRAYLPTNMYRTRWWDLVRYFAEGAVPMALGGSYEWHSMREASSWDDEVDAVEHLGFLMMPRPSKDVSPVCSLGGTSWGVFRQSPVQDVCIEILKLMSADDVSLAFCEETLQISPYRSANRRLQSAEHPWLANLIPLLEFARHRPRVAQYIRMSGILQDMFERVLWEGGDPEATVHQTVQTLSLVFGGVLV
jgi:multiple sugar transport system substrate-binding protein